MTEWKKDKVYQQLRRLPKSQLIEMAGEFTPPVEIGKLWNRNMVAGAIRKRQVENNSSEAAEPQDNSDVKDNAEFEAALQTNDGTDADAAAEPKKDGRGGVRPGAGRKLGISNDMVVVDRALRITEPNRTIKAALKMLFEAWALKSGVSLVALTEEEAINLAIPYTQILELHGLTKYIPHELEIYIVAAWTTWDIVKAKRSLIVTVQDAKKKAVPETPEAKKDGE